MYDSIYSGQVLNTADPAQAGRLQVIVPAVMAAASGWASVCVAPGTTSAFKVGQAVWVMFEGGSPDNPVVMGVKP